LYPFELVGFDILVDENMKPWILEINNTPSLVPHTTIENKIKKELISDLFDLVDIENKQFSELDEQVKKKFNKLKK
jgi:D-alanine-D-alanine ligase-like ATP-grasp enzyme